MYYVDIIYFLTQELERVDVKKLNRGKHKKCKVRIDTMSQNLFPALKRSKNMGVTVGVSKDGGFFVLNLLN